jgi:hypothetical protein
MAGMEAATGESGTGTGSAGSASGEAGQDAGSGSAAGGSEAGSGAGSQGGAGEYGTRAGGMPGSGSSGPLTPAEQVAILDARLEKGTGEFDSMILEEQASQRRSARERPPTSQSGSGAGGNGGEMAEAGEYGGEYGEGSYSTGSGIGGAGSGGGDMPQDAAKYPPPKDIPSGNDDDVVARQLREAAMREPDPAVREKLWDEYRKYKGISK